MDIRVFKDMACGTGRKPWVLLILDKKLESSVQVAQSLGVVGSAGTHPVGQQTERSGWREVGSVQA